MPYNAHFDISRSRDGQFCFRLVAGNGKTTLQSETYKTRLGTLRGIESVQREASRAEIRDLSQSDRKPSKKSK